MHFLALELVEGEPLAERVAKGPLPVEEALEVCRQSAEGVEAAHEKGVIHRDVNPDGQKFVMFESLEEETNLVVVLNWFEKLKRLGPTH